MQHSVDSGTVWFNSQIEKVSQFYFYPLLTIYSFEGWQAGWTSANVNGQLQRGYNTNSTKKNKKGQASS